MKRDERCAGGDVDEVKRRVVQELRMRALRKLAEREEEVRESYERCLALGDTAAAAACQFVLGETASARAEGLLEPLEERNEE